MIPVLETLCSLPEGRGKTPALRIKGRRKTVKQKRILSAILGAALLLSLCVLPASAAVEESYDTFDYRAYANVYPDLKAAYGYDAAKLYAHYVNFGKAEGRIGTFISGNNPKTNAPLYGVPPIPAGATLPATLLDPLPPKDSAGQVKWSQETTNCTNWSNAKLVAEYYSMKSIMEGEDRKDYVSEITLYYWQATLPGELGDRYDAVVENDPNFHSPLGDVYGRAMQSDTRILYQFFDGYKDFAAPPADPGTPGNPPAKTVGGFSDVTEKDYFADPVVWAVGKEITGGTGNGRFSPGSTCTQAQILTFLWRAKGSPEPEDAAEMEGFDGTEYYYKAARWAAEQDLAGDEFRPDQPCTRALAVTFLWKQAGSPAAPAANFTDVPAEAGYAQAVAWAVEEGVTGGVTAETFAPDQTCTRGQIMTFLYRAFAG